MSFLARLRYAWTAHGVPASAGATSEPSGRCARSDWGKPTFSVFHQAFLSAFVILLPIFSAAAQPRVVINEIHFDPADKKSLEFVELHNPGATEVSLGGWLLGKSRFGPTNVLAPGGFAVVATDPATFQKTYGFAPLGQFAGKLSNEGERIALRDAGGKVVDEVRYEVGFPWPAATAGAGSSLERVHPSPACGETFRSPRSSSECYEPVIFL